MMLEPATLSVIAGSVLFGVLGAIRRWRTPGAGGRLIGLAETYMRARVDLAHEREHRATIIAVLAALPPGATVMERHADGTELVIQTSSAYQNRDGLLAAP
jgi:hypothetical protein